MESSGSSSVSDLRMWIHSLEGEELAEVSKDLLKVHARLIMAGVLTMEESKPVLSRAFFALRRFDLNAAGTLLSYDCDRLESLLEQREEARSRRPVMVAAHQVAQERIDD